MKRDTFINLLGVGLLMLQTPVIAQVPSEALAVRQLRFSNVSLRGVGDSLLVNLVVDVSDVRPGKMERISITPLLVDTLGGGVELNTFFIDGKMRERVIYRDAILNRKRIILVSQKKYVYKESFAFLPWMETAQLRIRSSVDCCGGNTTSHFKTLADSITYDLPSHRYEVKPKVNFLVPDAEPIKNRMERGSAKLEFLSGKSEILLHYKNNRQELEKIGEVISALTKDTTATVQSILLRAYSSPEGSYATNAKLSTARSAALKSYLETAYGLKGIQLMTESVPEDWDGLMKLIAESDIIYKDRFLDIIAKNADPDRREQLFKTVAKGVPYREMLTRMFPLLRRTEYELNYSVKEFTVEQGREVFKKQPGQLSLNEMFHVANSYRAGSDEFNEVFDVAVRLFPDNPVANINASAVALLRGDTLTANRFLLRVKEDVRAQNNMAVYYALTGDLEEAKKAIQRASQVGTILEEVAHNQAEIDRKEKDNALFDKYKRKK